MTGTLSPTAQASGFSVARFGGEHGTVLATNPTALYYNPAGIGFSEFTQLFVDGQLALRRLEWTHAMGEGDVPEPDGYEGANYGTATATNIFGGPMLGATMRLGRFAVGAAVYAPFAGQVHFDGEERWEDTEYPGAADGVARWHGIDASTMSIYGTLGLAYRIGPLSIGVSGNLIFSSVGFWRAQSHDNTNDMTLEARARLDVDGVHGSFGAGAMIEAVPDTLWLAGSYQAQPGLGTIELDGKFSFSPVMGPEGEATDVTMHEAMPDVIRLGARYRPSQVVELRLAGDLTRWSVLQTQCIGLVDRPCTVLPDGSAAPDSGVVTNRRLFWDDTFGVRGGGSYWLKPSVELFAGMGFETAAAPDETMDPVLADANNLSFALGARLQLARAWFLAMSYTHLQFFSRDTTGQFTQADPDIGTESRRLDGGGEYSQWVGVLNFNLQVSLP